MNIIFIIPNLTMNVPFMHFQNVNLKFCACFQKPVPSQEALSGDFYSIWHIYSIDNLLSPTRVNPSFHQDKKIRDYKSNALPDY